MRPVPAPIPAQVSSEDNQRALPVRFFGGPVWIHCSRKNLTRLALSERECLGRADTESIGTYHQGRHILIGIHAAATQSSRRQEKYGGQAFRSP